jgi:hypothetical protein
VYRYYSVALHKAVGEYLALSYRINNKSPYADEDAISGPVARSTILSMRYPGLI